jgi:hypothetical protein
MPKMSGSSRDQGTPDVAVTASGRLLMRFAPPHVHGSWERPELAVQQRLRHEYQSEWLHL